MNASTSGGLGMYFAPTALDQFTEEYSKINKKYEQLLTQYISRTFKDAAAYEYASQGFVRRIGTLKRCIENIYNIYPPARSEKPSRDESLDLTINLQSFLFNVFGCIDNLALMWVNERQISDGKGALLKGKKVGLTLKDDTKTIRGSFSQGFQDYLNSLNSWFSYLEDFRHALAHRIPLYIPPFSLTKDEEIKFFKLEEDKMNALKQHNIEKYQQLLSEQNELGKFVPCMLHSYREKSRPVVFHAQVLADWNTVIDIAEKLFAELS